MSALPARIGETRRWLSPDESRSNPVQTIPAPAERIKPRSAHGIRLARLFRTRGIEARKVAIGLGISGTAKSLAGGHDRRPATRFPGGARIRLGLLLFRRLRRGGTNDVIAVDAEVGGLAGRWRSADRRGRRFGVCGSGRRACPRGLGWPPPHPP